MFWSERLGPQFKTPHFLWITICFILSLVNAGVSSTVPWSERLGPTRRGDADKGSTAEDDKGVLTVTLCCAVMSTHTEKHPHPNTQTRTLTHKQHTHSCKHTQTSAYACTPSVSALTTNSSQSCKQPCFYCWVHALSLHPQTVPLLPLCSLLLVQVLCMP